MRVRAAVLGHCRAPLDGAARPRGPHAAPASGARQRRRLPPPGVRARDRDAALFARRHRRVKEKEKGREKMKLGFGARAAERSFCSARARRRPSDEIRRLARLEARTVRHGPRQAGRGHGTFPAQAQVAGLGARAGRRCC